MLEGGCRCGAIRYTLLCAPMIVHACHCEDCRSLVGAPFVVNAWIEAAAVTLEQGAPRTHTAPTASGAGQEASFCGTCSTQVWSRFLAGPQPALFVRVGTLDDPTALTPDVHIYTRSKLPWVVLGDGIPSFEAFYPIKEVWTEAALERLRALRTA